MRNSGTKAVPEAEVVQFLPPTMRYVSGPSGAEVGEGRVTWSRSLEPGERATTRTTGEITGVREGGPHPVATVCVRPAPGAVLVSCDSAVERVHAAVPPVWVVTGLAFAASVALCVGGLVRHRHMREPDGAPAPAEERLIVHVPGPRTASAPGGATGPAPVPEHPAEPVSVPEYSTEPVSVDSAEPAHEPETVPDPEVLPVSAARAAELDAHH
ncbi:hypothetical protein [Nocardiopsis halotolerans]|uniref:hypothetical protein n=1 Tax=Nocardiopsis halotolerans TaxID=124252 RepID=UPI001F4D2AFA|nr:hypothetical protein [Nocardiopsis halotolerans]